MVAVFFFWEDYFKIYKVVSINVSHTVYQNAIPLRIATRNKIPAYQLNFSHAFYLTNRNFFAYKDFIYYKNEFKKIPVEIKNRGKLLAKKNTYSAEVPMRMYFLLFLFSLGEIEKHK